MSEHYGLSTRTLRRYFDHYKPPSLTPDAPTEPVALTFDGTFFGRDYGLLVFRANSKNIHWIEIKSERIEDMREGLLHLQNLGWKFSSITIDGRKGAVKLIETLFPDMPVQICIFHQKAIVRRYLTSKPKTECGIAIKNLTDNLKDLSEEKFADGLQKIHDDYADFLKERNSQGQFKHRELRSATRSLKTNLHYIFTYKRFPELAIPPTANSCDGSFSHWKNKVKIHRGLRHHRRTKMIKSLLAATQK